MTLKHTSTGRMIGAAQAALGGSARILGEGIKKGSEKLQESSSAASERIKAGGSTVAENLQAVGSVASEKIKAGGVAAAEKLHAAGSVATGKLHETSSVVSERINEGRRSAAQAVTQAARDVESSAIRPAAVKVKRTGVRICAGAKQLSKLAGQIEQSIAVLEDLVHRPSFLDGDLPYEAIRSARGLVFLTLVHAGFVWSATVGAGIVVRRLKGGGWSAPTSVGTLGMGFGIQAGAQKVDTIITLGDDDAIKAFLGRGQLKIGGDVSFSVGTLGRNASAEARIGGRGVASSFSWSRAQGLFGGITMEGALLVERPNDNADFYGTALTNQDILTGGVQPPAEAARLYALLKEIQEADLTPPPLSVGRPAEEPSRPAFSAPQAGWSPPTEERLKELDRMNEWGRGTGGTACFKR